MAQHDCAVSLPSVEILNCDVDCRSVISLLVLVGLVHVVKAGEFGFVSNLLTARLLDHRLMEVTGTNLLKSRQLSWSYNDNCQETEVGSLNRLQIIQDGYIDRAVYKLEGYVEDNTAEQMQLCLNGKPSGVRVQPLEDHKRRRRGYNDNDGVEKELTIEGLLIEQAVKLHHDDDGTPQIMAENPAVVRIFGVGISSRTVVAFTDKNGTRGEFCDKIKSAEFIVRNVRRDTTALIDISLPLGSPFFICGRNEPKSPMTDDYVFFKHQGHERYKVIYTYKSMLPLWLCIVIIITCLSFSALFSGLNLGLMAIDRTELKILCNTGTEKEKRYARTIQPVRNHGNYLLCSILFSNVLVNSIFTIILEELTSGFVAVFCSTLAIVIIGEISPQAICSRHGLCVGAKTIYITKLTMLFTFPLSYPISKILDFLLGEEIGNVYNRERLKELVKVTTGYNDLEKDEVNIIAGALELRKKNVADVMTRIEDVYMLDYDRSLDFETVSEIMSSGFSRIPVFEGNRTNIVTMLYIKDLAFVDPDDNMPLKTVCHFYQNPCNFVFEDVTLDVIFKQFKEGHKGHMAFVQRVNSEGEGDPFYEVIGLVTLEDVIEELIQAEIIDETDVFIDNRSKRKRQARSKVPDFTVFAEKKENQRIYISPQLTLAMFQYLSTSVESFKPDIITEPILRRLLKQDIIYHIKVKSREKARNDPTSVIYQQGKAVDFFVLILEGRVEVTVGKENLMFESGPFTCFGIQALTTNIGIAASTESTTISNPQALGSIQSVNLDVILRHSFVPDYSVRAVTEVFYVKIKRSLYLAAKRATLLEQRQKDTSSNQDQFDDEVEKLLHSLDEDDRSVPESPILAKDKDINNIRKESAPQSFAMGQSSLPVVSVMPVSTSVHTHSSFTSKSGPNGKLKNSPVKENTVAAKLPKFDLYKECPSKRSLFRKYYERGLFPVVLEAQGNGGQRIAWKVHSLEHLDYHFYLPLFFDGLTEVKKPYSFLVEQGITEMLEAGSIRILPVLPQLIIPIKKAFNTKVPEIVSRTLKMLQYLVRCENCIGEALVPYFRQILPIFNLFKERNDNRGDGIDISKQCSDIVADLIQETLEIFEQHGGEDAFINIKYIVPTYESCVRN